MEEEVTFWQKPHQPTIPLSAGDLAEPHCSKGFKIRDEKTRRSENFSVWHHRTAFWTDSAGVTGQKL
jgi:hypothetical protein